MDIGPKQSIGYSLLGGNNLIHSSVFLSIDMFLEYWINFLKNFQSTRRNNCNSLLCIGWTNLIMNQSFQRRQMKSKAIDYKAMPSSGSCQPEKVSLHMCACSNFFSFFAGLNCRWLFEVNKSTATYGIIDDFVPINKRRRKE